MRTGERGFLAFFTIGLGASSCRSLFGAIAAFVGTFGCTSQGVHHIGRASDASTEASIDANGHAGAIDSAARVPTGPRDSSASDPRDAARDAAAVVTRDGRNGPPLEGSANRAFDAFSDRVEGGNVVDADGNADSWVPVDLHTHADFCDSAHHTTSEIAALMDGAGIRAASVLLWGNWTNELASLTGFDDPASSPAHLIHFDVEISGLQASTGGHLLLLGLPPEALPEVWKDPDTYPGGSGVPITDTGFGRFAALRGMAHSWTWPADGTFPAPPLGCCMALELPVHVARGRVDFISTEYDFEDPAFSGSLVVWERLLQSGFKLPFVPASDWSCLQSRIGALRSWVMIDGAFSYSAVLAGVKAGRVVALADDSHRWLDMRVNGARLGDTVAVATGEPLDIQVSIDQPEAGAVRLVVNGVIAHEEIVPAGRHTLRMSLTVNQSAWIRASMQRGTTSPIYVTVDGAPIRPSAEAPCYFMRYLDHLSSLVASGAVNVSVDEPVALEAYAEARSVFEKRFMEAGGQDCR
ncbi:MAG TPA: CehA/McbA family metallohydrolase [Polyangiaceae bacterium]|nr:CehA/McbA family metallohydrolase [Polyangiaceae bacterium]